MSQGIPPLPDSLVLDILSYLLPPSPLPSHVLHHPLLDRLTFLPPEPTDLDAFLCPLPSLPAQPLSTRLHEMAHGHTMSGVEYASDGETAFARRGIYPTTQGAFGDNDGVNGGLQLEFGYTTKDDKGWGFHGCFLPEPPSPLSWSGDINTLRIYPNGEEEHTPELEMDATGDAPASYWADFSPPHQPVELSITPSDISESTATAGAEDDDYWAQYSAPPSVQPSNHPSPLASRKGSALPPVAPSVSADQVDKLTTALSGLSPLLKPPVPAPVTVQEETLKPRMTMKITSILRTAWKEYLGDSDDQGDMEEKAMKWLAMGRSARRRSNGYTQGVGSSEDERIAMAKLHVLEEMYALIANDEDEREGGFYRLVEGALRKDDVESPNGESRERRYSTEQASYWES